MAGLFAMTSYFDQRFQLEHPRTQFKSSGRKHHVTYDDVHRIIEQNVSAVQHFKPDVILAVGGGGMVPARVLRTFLPQLPLISISVNMYNDVEERVNPQGPQFLQWVDEGTAERFLKKKRVLVVDDIDESRKTLNAVLKRLGGHNPAAVSVFVLFSKDYVQKAPYSPFVMHFIVGEHIAEKTWVEFPWEATDLEQHEREADRECSSPLSCSPPTPNPLP